MSSWLAYLCPSMLDHGLPRSLESLDQAPRLDDQLVPSRISARRQSIGTFVDLLHKIRDGTNVIGADGN